MFSITDLFQWARIVSHSLVGVFYWLAVALSVLFGLAGAISSLVTMTFNPFVGFLLFITSLLGGCMGVILTRVIAELVLLMFCISEHLSAIRNQRTALSGERMSSSAPWPEDGTVKSWYTRMQSRPSFQSMLTEAWRGFVGQRT